MRGSLSACPEWWCNFVSVPAPDSRARLFAVAVVVVMTVLYAGASSQKIASRINQEEAVESSALLDLSQAGHGLACLGLEVSRGW